MPRRSPAPPDDSRAERRAHGSRSRLLLLASAALLVLTIAAAVRAGDDPPSERERWLFGDGEHERLIDVTSMPEFVRQALVERLSRQGFARMDREAAPPTWRDLESDALTLVRHHGRFPDVVRPEPSPGRPSLLARVLRTLAGGHSRLLGATLRREPSGWRIVAVPRGTVASAVGLGPGDVVLRLDGRSPVPLRLCRWASAPTRGGKLSLLVRRREDRIQIAYELEFAPIGE